MRILLTGASGNLGAYLIRELCGRGADIVAWSGRQKTETLGIPSDVVELGDPKQVAEAFKAARPAIVLHAGAMASPAECFRAPERARQINIEGTAALADAAVETGARLVLVSTDLVFDGEQGWYRETDRPNPLSIYGKTKLAAEKVALAHPRNVVARVSLLFGPTLVARPSFFDEQVASLRDRRPCQLFSDEWRTPLGLHTAARVLAALSFSDFQGTIHLGGPERLSRLEMGLRLARFFGHDPSNLVSTTRNQGSSSETRPRDLALDSALFGRLFPGEPRPSFEDALAGMGLSRE
jgi:dTDP-4-dehydrorhamnose reductase